MYLLSEKSEGSYIIFLEKAIFACVCILPFSLLIIMDDITYGTVTAKNYLFRLIISICLVLSSFCFLEKFKLIKLRQIISSKIFISILAYSLVLFISDLLGINFSLSFWSTYSRMDGYVNHIHLVLFFIILSLFLDNSKKWYIFLNIVLFISIILFLFGFLQRADLFPSMFENRYESLSGNPIYFGFYSGFCAILALFFYIQISSNVFLFKKNFTRLLGKFYFLSICCVNLFSVYLGQSRSSILALLVALFIVAIVNIFINKDLSELKLFLRSILIALFLTSISIVFVERYIAPSKSIVNRIDLSASSNQSINSRFLIWKQAFEAIQEKPFLGWGQENFPQTTKYAKAELWSEPWQDRAHNIFLDVLISSGFIGLLCYLNIFFNASKYIFNKPLENISKIQISFLFGGLVYYLVHNFFVFDSIYSYFFLYLLLSYLLHMSLSQQSYNITKFEVKNLNARVFISLAASMLISIYVYKFIISDLEMNKKLYKAATGPDLFYRNSDNELKLIIENLLEHSFIDKDHGVELMLSIAITAGIQQPEGVYKQYIFSATDKVVRHQLEQELYTAKFLFYVGNFYLNFNKTIEAELAFIKGLEKYPNNLQIMVLLGKTYVRQNKLELALKYFKKAHELDSNFKEADYLYNNLLKSFIKKSN